MPLKYLLPSLSHCFKFYKKEILTTWVFFSVIYYFFDKMI